MVYNSNISAFVNLGRFLTWFVKSETSDKDNHFYNQLSELVENLQHHNGWFTPEQVMFSLQQWAEALTEENINQWLSNYDLSIKNPKNIGLILAGNIPLVGFHDFISVLLSGHNVLVKLSSDDNKLIKFMSDFLIHENPEFKNKIIFVEGKLENFDAVIATGSNNTSRYFEYYFREVPSVIRKNRNSVAVLTGEESQEDLINLGEDIFRYFGLGCRNVSKLFVPEGYDFKNFFEAMYHYRNLIEYEKYANNYDYNKAVYLISRFDILDNGFMTIKEDIGYASPISSVFYEFYSTKESLKNRLTADKDLLQCVVSNNFIEQSIAFGQTQRPKLWDYADGVDTIDFLSKI
ncbi:MAG TPA: acyl-CoA reductase [Flavobacterium sp.]|nr:acyl-CoA reductase [Flavobacterium sp.]